MSDLIRREDVIAVLCFCEETKMMLCKDLRKILEKINAIPSAEPEQKGEWLEKEVFDNVDYEIPEWQTEKCSVCGKYHTTPYLYNFSTYKYCPNCGLKMTGGEDGKA